MTDFARYFRKGTQLLHQGEPKRAVSYLQRARELDPTHPDASLNLGGAYILTKQFKQAVAILEPLSEIVPDNAMIWTNLGAAYLGNPVLASSDKQMSAIAAFEKALEIDPFAPNVAYNIALVYRDRQEAEWAVFWFRRALQANPNDVDARLLLSRLLTAADDGN